MIDDFLSLNQCLVNSLLIPLAFVVSDVMCVVVSRFIFSDTLILTFCVSCSWCCILYDIAAPVLFNSFGIPHGLNVLKE